MRARKLITLLLALVMVMSATSALADFTPTPIGEIGNATREYVEPPEGDWKTPYDPVVNIRFAKGQGSDVVFEPGEDQTHLVVAHRAPPCVAMGQSAARAAAASAAFA